MLTKRPGLIARWVALALGIGLSWAPLPASADIQNFAVIVGYNQSDDQDLKPLRYADDDALRTGELLSYVSEQAVVLTELDSESRRLWPNHKAVPPTRAALTGALAELDVGMRAAHDRGDDVVLYFVYSGHGNYDAEGRGYVHLADGRFTTRDLYHHVIALSNRPRTKVILLVDACNAALLVHSRGSSKRRVAGPSTLRLENYPNVGVVLASSSVGETHEWGRFLAGVFSHEVRSALLGPGDINDDGRVSFAELASFVAAANHQVHNPNIRLRPYIRPPLSAPNMPIIDLAKARFPTRLRVDGQLSGRVHVLDQDLVRVADFHNTAQHRFWLSLPQRKRLVLVRGEVEYLVPPNVRGDLSMSQLETRPRRRVSTRGAGSEYFDRTLFHTAHSPQYAKDYLSSSYLDDLVVKRLVRQPWYDNTGAWVTLGVSALSLAGALGYHVTSLDKSDAAFSAIYGDDRMRLNGQAGAFEDKAMVMYGIGGAALLGSALWFALDRPLIEERYDPPLELTIGPQGVSLRTTL